MCSVQTETYSQCKSERKVKSLSRVQLSATPWTVAYQAPPSVEVSRQQYWSGLPFSLPGDFPNPGIEPRSPALKADALPSERPGKPNVKSTPNFKDFIQRNAKYLTDNFYIGFPGGSAVKNLPANASDSGLVPGSGRSPGGGNGNHCSILAWRVPWTEEPGWRQSMGSQRVRHNLTTKQQQQFLDKVHVEIIIFWIY